MNADEAYIERYIKKQLPSAEMESAHARYMSDSVFAKAVDEMRQLMELAHMSRQENMRTQVKAAGDRFFAQEGASRPMRRVYWSAAAAFLVLAVAGAFWILRPPLGERIFKEEFMPPPSYENFLGTPDAEAYRKYEAGDYAGAIPLLQAIPRSDSGYAKAQVYIAISQLALGETAQAITGLKSYLDTHTADDLLYPEAKWYLALALVRAESFAEARKVLEEIIAAPGATHRREAERVLGRIG